MANHPPDDRTARVEAASEGVVPAGPAGEDALTSGGNTEAPPPGAETPGTRILPPEAAVGETLYTARLGAPGPPMTSGDVPVTRQFLSDPPPTTAGEREKATLVSVPGYEVLGTLGRGGMGIVLKARDPRLDRIVAIKMVLAGRHASSEDRSRFRTEAEAAARIHHPGIVHIYEIGENDGTPYLALEYLPGGTLADRLHGTPLPAKESARILEQLARAVQAAHAVGVVHRDLKPSNIFFSAAGVPKIGDFGLAKRMDVDASHTHTGAIMGTPSYMAPEQAAGRTKEIGPPADVYALGSILYELLTGHPPFKAVSMLDTLEQVRSQEAVAPRTFLPGIPRDLETIALKCLEKDAARRYVSAAALADDCAAFLRGEPIQARPTPAWERAIKWAKRRPSAAALLVVSTMALLILLGLWGRFTVAIQAQRDLAERERKRAETNFTRAVQAVDQLLTEVAEDQLASEPRMEQKRRAILERALGYYVEFLEEKSDDPKLRGETAIAARRVGDIHRLLGQQAEAQKSYGKAIELLTSLIISQPEKVVYAQALADSYNNLGEAQRRNNEPAAALTSYEKASEIYQKLDGQAGKDPTFRLGLARALYNRGIVLQSMGRAAEAVREHNQAIEVLERLVAESPNVPINRQELARALLNLASAQRAAGDPTAAEKAGVRALGIQKKLVADFPNDQDYRHELGVSLNNAGNLLRRLKRLPEAEAAQRQSEQLFGQLVRDFPSIPEYRKELANTRNSLSLTLEAKGDPAGAIQTAMAACDGFEQLAKTFSANVDYQIGLGRALSNLGGLYFKQNQLKEAMTPLERSVKLLDVGLKEQPDNLSGRIALRNACEDLVEILLGQGDHISAAGYASRLTNMCRQSRDYCQAAGLLARCAASAEKDTKLPERDRRDTAAGLIGKAIELLSDGVKKRVVGSAHLDNDSNLEPLRQRADCREPLNRLREMAKGQEKS